MLKLEVKDNFLSDKEFKIILNNLDRIYFDYRDKGKDDYTDGFRHSFIPDENNKWFFEKLKKLFSK